MRLRGVRMIYYRWWSCAVSRSRLKLGPVAVWWVKAANREWWWGGTWLWTRTLWTCRWPWQRRRARTRNVAV